MLILSFRYWQPNESVFPSADYDESFNHDYTPRPSYDSALTAYAQLGALRCNAKRGMISVVDQTSQYIIAEGTKTLSLQDGTVVDQDDQLWFGLRTIPRAVGICATALGQFTTVEAHDGSISDTLFEPLQFIIPDLSKDPRFTNQPFVCGAPYLRFYAGVPIRSPAGFIIGIYSIVDDKPRDDFGERDLTVLKDLAATVMDHLVLGTVRGRHHRADRMVKGLGLFVEGKATLRDWWLQSGHLAKGPTTKDGSRGDWTLKAQADAEFGQHVDTSSKKHIPKQANSGTFEYSKPTIGGSSSPSPGEVDSTTRSLSDGTPTVDCTMSKDQNSSIKLQENSSEEPGVVNSSDLISVSNDTANLSLVQNSVSSDSTKRKVKDSLKEPEAEMLTMPQDMEAMFRRASNLIRESITVEGCLFLDVGSATVGDTPIHSGNKKPKSSKSDRSTSSDRSSTSEEEMTALNSTSIETEMGGKSSYEYPGSSSHGPMCEILGYSLTTKSHQEDGVTKPEFRIPRDLLHRLVKRYPRGSILNFEHDGSISSSEEDLNGNSSDNLTLNSNGSKLRNKKEKAFIKELDSKIIIDTFPGIRCLAFFPLWDTSTKSWFCGALAWTNDPLRVLDPNDDMAYLAAFGNSIMAERARLDASMADRMKSNFISTVSHELRSPLHGILASTELLKDMSIVPAQIDVINMINVCGRTLLDTINHVLDFTELNRSRKSKLSGKKKSSDRSFSKPQKHSANSLVNQIANLDLSVLVEEVVDSTLAGNDFGLSGSIAVLHSDPRQPFLELDSKSHRGDVTVPASGHVKVILDIDYRSNWVFAFRPGAWRRILMNLFGNALKYTKSGYVCVSLKSIASVTKQDSGSSVILTVRDTGKGISKQFLKHHIFTPFLQEDSLATGTGLGLSIVKQIVHDLDGQIDIKSEEGWGTMVTVQIPFGFPHTTPSPSRINGDDAHFETVRQNMSGLKVYILSSRDLLKMGNDDDILISETDAAVAIKKSLCKTLKQWFNMVVVEAPSLNSAEADIYLLLEDEITNTESQDVNDNLPWKSEIIQLAKAKTLIILSTTQASSGTWASEWRKLVYFVQQP